ncbi:histidinol-phosphate transaminase [bacterium]|nr:MAG: histidinol-phosphate transaminase [bacterium]
MGLARKNVENITAYIAGKPIEETRRQLGLKRVIKLASNENPLGVSPLAVKAMKAGLNNVNRYPDSQSFYLKNKLAKVLKVKPDNIILGNGSDELIDVIVKTFVENDEEVLTSDVTFLEYGIISQVNDRRVSLVGLKDFKYDLNALRQKVTANTKLIFIANPNNPTGTYVKASELTKFINSLPKNVLVVLDEAYDAFIDVGDFPKNNKILSANKNVIILKTFSKAYGLAGLRIGYALADAGLVSFMEKVRQPFNVNSLAQIAAMAALDDKRFLSRTRKTVLSGKNFIYRQLDKMGVGYVPSVANFILIDTQRDGVSVFKDMLKLGVIVRDMKQYGLNNFIRVTIGTKEENNLFIKAFKKILR